MSGDRGNHVVRLVVFAVESVQPLDRHVLDIGARSDGGFSVVVPKVSRGTDALLQDARYAVFAALELVAHHGHLTVEKGLVHFGTNHAVGFQTQRPTEILVTGGHGFEVVRPVVVSTAVPRGAVAGQLLL